jgi:hypothetical protein
VHDHDPLEVGHALHALEDRRSDRVWDGHT